MKTNRFTQQAGLLFATIVSSAVIGCLIAFFLWLLERTTQFRNAHPYLLFALPIAGVVIFFAYRQWGKISAKGNNLIIDAINKKNVGVPLVMTPLVLFGTIITHLFGGSAGREGTAVQIGGSIAEQTGKLFQVKEEWRTILLMTGIAAGFSAVFGTPITGIVFAMEVLVIGKMQYKGVLHIIVAAFVANFVCLSFPIHHTHYHINIYDNLNFYSISLWSKLFVTGILFGFASNLFSMCIFFFKKGYGKIAPKPWLVPVTGAIIIIVLAQIVGYDYLGLGVSPNYSGAASLTGAFQENGVTSWSWLWKLLFTTLTLSAGFKGGEVTPLFFIGAALGNVLGVLFHLPVDLMAGLGFIAVFAGATNTPIACSFMGLELFGSAYLPLYVIVCFVAFYSNGLGGIYESQLITGRKSFFSFGSKERSLEDYGYQGRLYLLRKYKQFSSRYL
ncbi:MULTISPECIES: chloride channel protein [Chitinophagaceae]